MKGTYFAGITLRWAGHYGVISGSRTVAEFVIGDVKAVRELAHERLVNAHLAEGWVLLLIREGSNVGHSPVSGDLETYSETSYTLGWVGESEPKSEQEHQDLLNKKNNAVDDSDF